MCVGLGMQACKHAHEHELCVWAWCMFATWYACQPACAVQSFKHNAQIHRTRHALNIIQNVAMCNAAWFGTARHVTARRSAKHHNSAQSNAYFSNHVQSCCHYVDAGVILDISHTHHTHHRRPYAPRHKHIQPHTSQATCKYARTCH